MFENKFIERYGIHYTRIIASWYRSGGSLVNVKDYWAFEAWMRDVGLTDDEIHDIRLIAENGKMEWENSAEKFIKEHPELMK